MNYLVCQHCGKQYTAKRSDSKYCSAACRVAFARRTHKESTPEELTVLDWRDDEASQNRARIMVDKVPRLLALIHDHKRQHGAIATKHLIETLWRMYTFISPDANKAKLGQWEYYEIWEHEVDKNGGFIHFWQPLYKSGKHRAWLKQIFDKHGVDLKDVILRDGFPRPN